MEKEIEKAIRETLVIGNPQSINLAVKKIMRIKGVMFSEERAKFCKDTSAWKECESWKKDFRCLKNCSLHLQT